MQTPELVTFFYQKNHLKDLSEQWPPSASFHLFVPLVSLSVNPSSVYYPLTQC